MKPLLLVDVDGVLNPITRNKPMGFDRHHLNGYDLWLSSNHGKWLTELSLVYDLVWATTWEHEAAKLVAPIVGLPEMPVVEFNTGGLLAGPTWKLSAVDQYVGDMPIAWIDDDLYTDAFQWAKNRNSPTLLIKINPTVGLTFEHCEHLWEFGYWHSDTELFLDDHLALRIDDTPASPTLGL